MPRDQQYVSWSTRHMRADLRARMNNEARLRTQGYEDNRTAEDVMNEALEIGLNTIESQRTKHSTNQAPAALVVDTWNY